MFVVQFFFADVEMTDVSMISVRGDDSNEPNNDRSSGTKRKAEVENSDDGGVTVNKRPTLENENCSSDGAAADECVTEDVQETGKNANEIND